MEYKKFAKNYDMFYANKKYHEETEFLASILNNKKSILDAGCGTGVHASLLESLGYELTLLDLNIEMLNIAKKRCQGEAHLGNILDFNLNQKFDAIICMFAVLNHLKNKTELVSAFKNLKLHLKDEGTIIIDLHNPRSSGEKEDVVGNMKRIMKWDYDKDTHIEKSEIIYNINNRIAKDSHIFYIFSIDDIVECSREAGLKVIAVYENYTKNKGNDLSKNLQFILSH